MTDTTITNEEAIMILKIEMPSCGTKLTFTEGDKSEAFNMAISALEKQIPKKALIRYESMGTSPNESFKIYGCPCCKEDTDGETSFCQYCGQKIEYEDEE